MVKLKKDSWLNIRISKDQIEQIKKRSAQLGIKPSAYIRKVIEADIKGYEVQ